MAEIVSKSDAMHLIRESDFFETRLSSAKRVEGASGPGGALDALRNWLVGSGLYASGISKRERMVRDQFVRELFNAFRAQRPAAESEVGFDRTILEDWLEKLYAVELRSEMARIPKVRRK